MLSEDLETRQRNSWHTRVVNKSLIVEFGTCELQLQCLHIYSLDKAPLECARGIPGLCSVTSSMEKKWSQKLCLTPVPYKYSSKYRMHPWKQVWVAWQSSMECLDISTPSL